MRTEISRRLDLCLYVVTAEDFYLERSHFDVAKAAIDGGANVIQLRAKNKKTREILDLALRIREVAREAQVTFIVNDWVDIALAADADGVHLGTDDMPLSVARRILGDEKIVGASVENLNQAVEAVRQGADYLAIGPIFETNSKNDAGRPVGPGFLNKIKDVVKIPLVAIGGISPHNALEVLEAGADGIAVISAIARANDMKIATQTLLEKVNQHKR